MNPTLSRFNGDEQTKAELIAYLHDFIAEEGVRRMFARESVEHIADAKELIDGAFEQLSIDYGIKNKTKETTNESR